MTTDDPTYVRLHNMMADAYMERARRIFGEGIYGRGWFLAEAKVMLDAIWPEIQDGILKVERAQEHGCLCMVCCQCEDCNHRLKEEEVSKDPCEESIKNALKNMPWIDRQIGLR